MRRQSGMTAMRFDFGEMTFAVGRLGRNGLRLATAAGPWRGPDKYRLLDLKRRRAQIRARRILGLT
jgi:hypothetical protein